MKIKITETGKIENLSIIDPFKQIDYTSDFVKLDDFTYDENDDVFLR